MQGLRAQTPVDFLNYTRSLTQEGPSDLDVLLKDIFQAKNLQLLKSFLNTKTTELYQQILELGQDLLARFEEMPLSCAYRVTLLIQIVAGLHGDLLVANARLVWARCELDRFYKLRHLKLKTNKLPLLKSAFGSEVGDFLAQLMQGKISTTDDLTLGPMTNYMCFRFIESYFMRVTPGRVPGEAEVVDLLSQHSVFFLTARDSYQTQTERDELAKMLKNAVELMEQIRVQNKGSVRTIKDGFGIHTIMEKTTQFLWKKDNGGKTFSLESPLEQIRRMQQARQPQQTEQIQQPQQTEQTEQTEQIQQQEAGQLDKDSPNKKKKKNKNKKKKRNKNKNKIQEICQHGDEIPATQTTNVLDGDIIPVNMIESDIVVDDINKEQSQANESPN